jgi:hypothetical protein
MKTAARYFSLFIPIIIIAGCGGGGDTTSVTAPQPPQNSAPLANNDSAVTANNQSVTVAVLDNDTDTDNDSLSVSEILIEPKNGQAVINGQGITYTPNEFFAGNDSFTYVVSDGLDTAEAEVVVTSTQSLSMSGILAGNFIDEATVTLRINEETFSTQADNDGNYQLAVVLTSMSGQLQLNALGTAENKQGSVELISYLGNTSDIMSVIENGRDIVSTQLSAVNITPTSTARSLLFNEKNNGAPPTSIDQFIALLDTINAKELIDLASFINLLVDNPTYPIPEGETTLSILRVTLDTQRSLTSIVNDYLSTRGFQDENGNRTDIFETDLQTAIESTISNPETRQSFVNNDVLDRILVGVNGDIFTGFIPRAGEIYNFQAEGTGRLDTELFRNQNRFRADQFSWLVKSGQIHINFDDNMQSSRIQTLSFSDIETRWGIEAADLARAIAEQGELSVRREVITRHSLIVTPIAIGNTRAQVVVDETSEEILVLSQSNKFSRPLLTTRNFENFILSANLRSFEPPEESLVGAWALPIQYGFEPIIKSSEFDNNFDTVSSRLPRIRQDIVTLEANGTASSMFGEQDFSWSINDGALSLSRESERYEYRPLIEGKGETLVIGKHYNEEQLVETFVRKIAPVSDTFSTIDNFVAGVPLFIANVGFNGDQAEQWPNGQWNINNIRSAPSFNADGTINLVSTINDRSNNRHFFSEPLDNLIGSWESSGRESEFIYTGISAEVIFKQTYWYQLSKDEEGRSIVLQYTADIVFGNTFNPDGVIQPREAKVNGPTIEILNQLDMRDYPDAYTLTVERGEYPDLEQ